jgi:hypothetical protein
MELTGIPLNKSVAEKKFNEIPKKIENGTLDIPENLLPDVQ